MQNPDPSPIYIFPLASAKTIYTLSCKYLSHPKEREGKGAIEMAYLTKLKKGPSDTLTVDDLAKAIKNSIDKSGMETDAAKSMAKHVLNFFGYSDRIIDNVLEPEDRDAFYMLEDSGLLTTEREETTLYDGREWRIHYWLFRKEKIKELVEAAEVKEKMQAEEEGLIYSDIPDDIWNREISEEEEE